MVPFWFSRSEKNPVVHFWLQIRIEKLSLCCFFSFQFMPRRRTPPSDRKRRNAVAYSQDINTPPEVLKQSGLEPHILADPLPKHFTPATTFQLLF